MRLPSSARGKVMTTSAPAKRSHPVCMGWRTRWLPVLIVRTIVRLSLSTQRKSMDNLRALPSVLSVTLCCHPMLSKKA